MDSETGVFPSLEPSYVVRLAAMVEIGRTVTSILDLHDQLQTLVEQIKDRLGYYGVNVWVLTEPAEAVHLKAAIAPDKTDLSQLEFQLPITQKNSITQVCLTGEHYLCDPLDDPAGLPLGSYYPQAQAQIVLPLKIAQKNVGALELLSDHPGAINDNEILLLRSLADQATIAIRNATLYQSEQSRRRLAETLYQVGQALSSTIQLNRVLEMILRLLDEIVPCDRSAVMLRNGDAMEFVAVQGFPEDFDAIGFRLPLSDDHIFTQVFTTRQPLSIPDAHLYPNWQEIGGLPIARSWMGVPMILADQAIGMLSITREHLNPYSYAEVTLAQTFAGQAVIALENARLYDRLERFNQELEARVQERTEELRQAYNMLERLDATKTSFIQVTSHELRTPLTVLNGYSQMLMQNPTISKDPVLSQLVDGIYSGADRLHEIVNSMLDVIKIDSRALELNPEPMAIGLLVRNVAGNFKNALRNREIDLHIADLSGLPPVSADQLALQKVFYHLLSNAIKYTPNGGSIDIRGTNYPESKAIELVIADTGIGIDPEQQELIFTKFYQSGEVALHSSSRTQFKGGGPGLGLAVARGIVQAHGGRLWVESPGHDEQRCPGSQFHISLPAAAEISLLEESPEDADRSAD